MNQKITNKKFILIILFKFRVLTASQMQILTSKKSGNIRGILHLLKQEKLVENQKFLNTYFYKLTLTGYKYLLTIFPTHIINFKYRPKPSLYLSEHANETVNIVAHLFTDLRANIFTIYFDWELKHIFIKARRKRTPDLIVKYKGDEYFAIEIETNWKSDTRYQEIIKTYWDMMGDISYRDHDHFKLDIDIDKVFWFTPFHLKLKLKHTFEVSKIGDYHAVYDLNVFGKKNLYQEFVDSYQKQEKELFKFSS